MDEDSRWKEVFSLASNCPFCIMVLVAVFISRDKIERDDVLFFGIQACNGGANNWEHSTNKRKKF